MNPRIFAFPAKSALVAVALAFSLNAAQAQMMDQPPAYYHPPHYQPPQHPAVYPHVPQPYYPPAYVQQPCSPCCNGFAKRGLFTGVILPPAPCVTYIQHPQYQPLPYYPPYPQDTYPPPYPYPQAYPYAPQYPSYQQTYYPPPTSYREPRLHVSFSTRSRTQRRAPPRRCNGWWDC